MLQCWLEISVNIWFVTKGHLSLLINILLIEITKLVNYNLSVLEQNKKCLKELTRNSGLMGHAVLKYRLDYGKHN